MHPTAPIRHRGRSALRPNPRPGSAAGASYYQGTGTCCSRPHSPVQTTPPTASGDVRRRRRGVAGRRIIGFHRLQLVRRGPSCRGATLRIAGVLRRPRRYSARAVRRGYSLSARRATGRRASDSAHSPSRAIGIASQSASGLGSGGFVLSRDGNMLLASAQPGSNNAADSFRRRSKAPPRRCRKANYRVSSPSTCSTRPLMSRSNAENCRRSATASAV